MATESDILKELNDAFDNDTEEWREIQDEGQTDIQVISGDVWEALDPEGATQRKAAKRPLIAPDELSQYINQLNNEIRANPRGVKFSPTGHGANDDGADLYQNKTREIEYRSHATRAYTTAFENAVQRSYGYVRVNKRYVQDALFDGEQVADPSLFNQELWIDEVPNPDMVLPDPYCQRSDLSDMKRCFYLEWRTVGDFKRDFPEAKIQNFTPEVIAKSKNWFTKDRKQVLTAEYWKREQVGTRELLLLKPTPRSRTNPDPKPMPVWAHDLHKMPSSDQILQRRKVPLMKVKQRITNGIEILETNDWDGEYIPFAGCFGKSLYVDDGGGAKRKILSLIRLARDPYLVYCYLWSCECEIVGMTPKFPYFFYEGQLTPAALELLAKSTYEPVAGIPVLPSIPGITAPGQPLPFPQRNPMTGEALQYLELCKEAARRAIQAAMGMTPLPTEAQRRNEKSGVALRQIESSGQRGSYHFVDSYESMIRQVGVILEDLMDKTYDTARDIGIRKWDDKAEIVRINDPASEPPLSMAGDYQVTVSAGPSTDSQRQAADDLVDSLVGNIEKIASISGPQVARGVLAESIKNKVQGPSGDNLAEMINPSQDKPNPQQAEQAMAENQQLKQAVGQMQQAIQADTIKYQAQMQIETMKADKHAALELELKRMDLAAKIEVARISAAKQTADLRAESEEEALATGLKLRHEAIEGHKQRQHELALAERSHEQALEQGQQQVDGQRIIQAEKPQPQAGA